MIGNQQWYVPCYLKQATDEGKLRDEKKALKNETIERMKAAGFTKEEISAVVDQCN